MIKTRNRILTFSICILIVFGMINFTSSKAHVIGFVPIYLEESNDDIDDPVISGPKELNFTEGTSDQIIIWTLNDANPDTYTIVIEERKEGMAPISSYNLKELSRETGSWTDGQNVSYDASSLPAGMYYIRIEVHDSFDNSKTHYVTVIMKEPDTIASGLELFAGIISLIVTGTIFSSKRRRKK